MFEKYGVCFLGGRPNASHQGPKMLALSLKNIRTLVTSFRTVNRHDIAPRSPHVTEISIGGKVTYSSRTLKASGGLNRHRRLRARHFFSDDV